MNEYLIAFLIIGSAILGGLGYFLRGALFSISSVASSHAKTYAVAYIKGGSLILITAGAAFGTAYSALPATMQATLPWAPYAIFFWQPITAGLGVLVAFLDRSAQTASKEAEAEKAKTVPPFNSPAP